MVENRRIGCFSIPREFINKHEQAVRDCLCGLIVVEAEMHFDSDAIHYTAIGWPFPKTRSGDALMVVMPQWHHDTDTEEVHFAGWLNA